MGLSKVFLLGLLFAHCVFADKFIKLTCDDKDGDEYIKCTKDILEEFFKQHSTGAPDKGIKSTDPATVEHVDVVEDSIKIKYHYTNITVTGFKDAILSDYKEEEVKKDIEYKATWILKDDFIAEGPVRIERLNKDENFSGDVKYEAGTIGTVTYNYEVKKIDGKLVYEIGPEQLTCESQHAKATASEELRKELESASDYQHLMDEYAKIEKENQAKVACEFTKALLKKVVENIRVLGRNPELEA